MANLGSTSNLKRGLTLSAFLLTVCAAAALAGTPAQSAPAPSAPVQPAAATTVAAKPGPIILYTTSWCGYCRKTRSLLTELGVAYEDKDIEQNEAARKEYQAKGKGYTGIPLIDFDGTLIRGYNEPQLRSLAAARKKAAAPGGESTK